MTRDAVLLDGHVPIRVEWRADGPWIDWCHLGTTRLLEPFFDMTIEEQLRRPYNQAFRPLTPLAALEDWLEAHPPVPPTGFVFHMSRCGSTLVSQMLAACPGNIVVSEASPVDMALRDDPGQARVDDEQRIRLLRGIVSALGQRRQGQESRYFVKFDCWHTLSLGLMRRAFPSVPWLFLYRQPVEVLVSQMRQRGVQTVPGMMPPHLFGLDFASAVTMPAADYCARVLASLCRAGLEGVRNGGGVLVNYSELPDAIWETIPRHFQTGWTPAEVAAMNEARKFDAKAPSFPFAPDAAEKRREAREPVLAAAERWLAPVYRDLEALRLA